jgi:hypothetical protein
MRRSTRVRSGAAGTVKIRPFAIMNHHHNRLGSTVSTALGRSRRDDRDESTTTQQNPSD